MSRNLNYSIQVPLQILENTAYIQSMVKYMFAIWSIESVPENIYFSIWL